MYFSKGDKIGNYTVSFQHKEGAYAETYRVKDSSGKTRFLKLINYAKLSRNQIDDNGRVVEIEIAKSIDHPNICKYLDSGKVILGGGQQEYFVTEFISGETLSKKIARDGNLSVYEIKQVAKAVLSVLSYLHSRPMPIIHGEVTIQNVMLDLVGGYDKLKLIDFGHASYLNQTPSKPDLTDLNAFYLAPERFSGVSQVQSDLYSVGVMLYQLVYGTLPWFRDLSRIRIEDRVDAILAERDKELKFPEIDLFEYDDQFANCIAKALCYDVDSRFKTADEFMDAMDGKITIEQQSTRRKALVNPKVEAAKKKTKTVSMTGQGFAAVAGMDELKKQMREEVIDVLQNPEEYERYGITIPNGMLLYGPPGCGKTFFAKHFAEEVGFNFVIMTPASLKSRWLNAIQENIANMFKEAEANAPTIIFIDEINALVPNRESEYVHEENKNAVNEMLAQMDRTAERGIFVIGATNMPQSIDPAILRAGRLEKKYYIGAPDKQARSELFKMYLSNRPCDLGIDYDELADLTENYISADIERIVNDSARNALKEHGNITEEMLKVAIKNKQPSLTSEQLRKYEEIRQQMTGEFKEVKRNRIGFK
ncbi:MAG: AAA family ATPase [Prevotella sp.]|nr:AAA family ATPase [Prevotella sp.]